MTSPEPESPAADDRPEPSASERLEKSFADRAEAFAAAARRVRDRSDEEAIHDLRVATRRLVAALRVWRSLVPKGARRSATRSLRRLRRRIGRARELEVHVALLGERLPRRGVEGRPAVASVLLRLKGRLARRRRAASRRASPRRVRRVLRDIEDAAAGLRPRLMGDPAAIEEGMAVERELAAAARGHVREAAAEPEDVRLHEARIAVKKWRYALECLQDVVTGVSEADVADLRRMQRALGDVHDLALLRDLIGKIILETGEPAGELLQSLVERLEGERRRAVRRFQRRAEGLLGPEPPADTGTGGPAEPPPSLLAAGSDPGDERSAAAEGPRDVPSPDPDPRDVRWERMAGWLERTRGEPRE